MSALRKMTLRDWARVWFFAFLIVMAERAQARLARKDERRRLRRER